MSLKPAGDANLASRLAVFAVFCSELSAINYLLVAEIPSSRSACEQKNSEELALLFLPVCESIKAFRFGSARSEYAFAMVPW
ncbi:MAG: hypothetical protein JOY83_26480 [Alphaproteobacteria bacterium]|nr:hypothetical protein [Alphaproteobacteria bacterium]